jgi:hypothetical protein
MIMREIGVLSGRGQVASGSGVANPLNYAFLFTGKYFFLVGMS